MAWWDQYDGPYYGMPYGPTWGYDPGFYAGYSPAGWPYTPTYGWAPGPRYDRPFRTPPERSPTYGRGGDEAVRRWARSHGYDAEYEIQPRSGDRYFGEGPRRRSEQYDRFRRHPYDFDYWW